MTDQQIFNSLVEFFEEDHWDFQWLEESSILSMGFSGINGKWICYAQAREPEEQFVFYSVIPVNAPPKERHKVAEFITRVNCGMVIGNFEMDYDDGEIRYKTSVDLEGSELGQSMIRQLVYANLVITDRYLPGIMRVIYSKDNPVDIIDSIELDNPFQDDLGLDDMFWADEDDFDDDLDDFFDDDSFDDDDDDPPSLNFPPEISGGSPN